MYGEEIPIVYAGVCLTEGGADVDAAITLAELEGIFKKRGIKVEDQPLFFSRIPEERRRYWSSPGGLPLELLKEARQSSRRFRKLRGLGALEGIARAAASLSPRTARGRTTLLWGPTTGGRSGNP